METATLNLIWSDHLMRGLAAAGVCHVVISPGSRSTPLVLAVNRHSGLCSWQHPDERSAAFFALGLASDARNPVALIATSGSAPGHWLPAVIEANRAGLPLILLSADRPPELQACGSNQTVDQIDLFGNQVRRFLDAGPPADSPQAMAHIQRLGVQAVHTACWPNPGPVHINLPFREPLTPNQWPPTPDPGPAVPVADHSVPTDPAQAQRIRQIMARGQGLIVCGPMYPSAGFPQVITRLAAQLDCPLLVDPLSGLRFGNHDHSRIICRYDALLRSHAFKDRNKLDWVLRFGAAPVSKSLLDYLSESTAKLILCAPRGDWPDPLHQVTEMVRTEPVMLCESLLATGLTPGPKDWLARFSQAEQLAESGPSSTQEETPQEEQLIRELLADLPEQSLLFSGNSLPIRQLDLWSGQGEKSLRILANRGASGIDGNVSTLLGLAAAAQHPVVGLLGDLAFFHDMNGLLLARDLSGVIIVFNNNGGGIFGMLPQARLATFEQQWLMPTQLDFTHVARLYGLDHQRIVQQSQFRPALQAALQNKGVTLIEIILDREKSLASQLNYLERIKTAVSNLNPE